MSEVRDSEEVLEQALGDRVKNDEYGLIAGVTRRLRTDAFEVTLELELSGARALEFLDNVVTQIGRVVARKGTESDASLQAVIGAGFFNMMPAVTVVRVTELDSSRSRVIISGISKEGLIKQRAAEGAVRRILKEANLDAPRG